VSIDNEVPSAMAMPGPGERVACTIRRTATYGLHIHIAPQLESTSLAETIDAVATQLVLGPRFVVLETGPLRTADDHAASVGAIAALVRRAGIELRVVAPVEASSELLVRAGVLPAQGRFHSVESALNGRG
jgi:hypothetical protein